MNKGVGKMYEVFKAVFPKCLLGWWGNRKCPWKPVLTDDGWVREGGGGEHYFQPPTPT